MNILFVEDEKDLSAVGVEQMEAKGHRVIPVYDLAMAKEAIQDVNHRIQIVISDHQLPDGQGIHFVEAARVQYPNMQFAVVSGCLTTEDEMRLQEQGIPFFHKPLIYSKVLEFLRQAQISQMTAMQAERQDDAADTSTNVEAIDTEKSSEASTSADITPSKRKKFFGLF